MIKQVRKRDGQIQEFNKVKIADAIYKAAVACDGHDRELADKLADEVEKVLNERFGSKTPAVEQIQDTVEKVLITSFSMP